MYRHSLCLYILILTNSVCKENSVNVEMVKGKILVCDSLQYASTFKYLINGPVGVLMQDNRPKNDGRSYPMAASHLSRDRGGTEIEEYMSSTKYVISSAFRFINDLIMFNMYKAMCSNSTFIFTCWTLCNVPNHK